jgi:ribosomal protein S18 acetylase RimI-like enzyme
MNSIDIRVLDQKGLKKHLTELAETLHSCVHDGASISFILPFSENDSRDYWLHSVVPKINSQQIILFVAIKDGHITGTVQLDCNTPPNQPHRAEVNKLLVNPKYQRQGIAKKLMITLEEYATNAGIELLTLDTQTGDKAEPLYLSLGYEIAGVIPYFAQDPIEGKYYPTTLMFKKISE